MISSAEKVFITRDMMVHIIGYKKKEIKETFFIKRYLQNRRYFMKYNHKSHLFLVMIYF